jgi:hypothetical protein
MFPSAKGTLTVRIDGTETIYDLYDDYQKIDIKLESGYYEELRLTKDRRNWLFEVRRKNSQMASDNFRPTSTISVIPSTARNLEPTRIIEPTKTSIPSSKITSFSSCLQPCNGNNSIRTFPSATQTIYVQWAYENIPIGAKYTRRFTQAGREWARYDCAWPGPTTGIENQVKITEPNGLHSGVWEMTILINDVVVMKEQIEIQGNWTFWDPAGTFTKCYGIR